MDHFFSASRREGESGMHSFEAARGQLLADFSALIRDAEDLLRVAAQMTGRRLALARSGFQHQLENAKAAATRVDTAARVNMNRATDAGRGYIREHPWRAVAVGTTIGFVIGRLWRRH